MFCRDDQTFLCLFCSEIGHKTHNTVPIEQESGDRRTQLKKTQAEVRMMIQDREKKTEEIKSSVKANEKNNVKIFTHLIHTLERCQSELLMVTEQKQKAAEKQAEELIEELEQEIAELKRRDTKLEKLQHTEDDLHLLQTSSSVCIPPQVKSWTNISIDLNTDLNTETFEKAIQSLQENVVTELNRLFEIIHCPHNFSLPTHESTAAMLEENTELNSTAKGIFVFGGSNAGSEPKISSVKENNDAPVTVSTQHATMSELLNAKTSIVLKESKTDLDKSTLGKMDSSTHSPKKAGKINKPVKIPGIDLRTMQKLYAVDMLFDFNTAYPKLILSKDGKQVKHGGIWRDVPNNTERFNSSACVLGRDGFSCGRFYYEVQVSDKPEWDLGVAAESIERKGKITVCPENGFWCIWLRNGDKYMANESFPVSLSLREKPQKVGVFVDYEEGLVSFYNVATKSHIYSFSGQSFTEKLYPFFSPCNKRGEENTKPLIISTVSHY
ncbi:E3 ubiquitin-protein ligase TRIM39-like [Xyrauchen texanus]|uniref:E3 ubiquitin-protein ligase TRIM39-like n=1 Tax=Xyrauchen texanus TaxID=154827 RepID=UPI0022425CF6|nr:E3 ubiquitin-protein ligase TRIM39-like [Xyrauchen texanus]